MKNHYDVAVMGAGPGGLVAALYLQRFLRKTIVLSLGEPRASWIPKTHNILGYRAGITGQELLRRLHGQLDDLKTDRLEGDFIVNRKHENGFVISGISSGKRLEIVAKKVLLATGMRDVQPDLKNLDILRRRGLLRYCPICDAFEFRNKKMAVLARTEHGLKTAKFLSQYTKSLLVLWSGNENAKLEIANSVPLKKLKRRGVKIEYSQLLSVQPYKDQQAKIQTFAPEMSHEHIREHVVDVCYVALGSEINDSSFRHFKSLRRDEEGFLLTDSHQELSVPGMFAVGDCVSGLAQISVAAGQAAIAATRIHHQLNKA